MFQAIYYTHLVSVIVFMVIYLVKTFLLLSNKKEQLQKFSKTAKVPEMAVSFLFLATGGYMLVELPSINQFMIFKLVAVFASIPLAVVAYKKSNKALAVVSMLLIIGAYGLAEISKKRSSAPAVAGPVEEPRGDAAAAINAEELYRNYCTKCHGDDGKAGIMGATDISVTPMGSAEIAEVIKKGKGMMVSVPLSDEQAKAVSEYVVRLKK